MSEATSTGPGSSDAWAGHSRGSASYRRLLAALFCAGIATLAQLYSPQATLPQIAGGFGVGAAESALAVSAATVGLAAGVIPWSALSDRIGRIRVMFTAVTAATALGLLVPFAPSFPLFLTGRLLEGLMIAGVPAIAIAYLSEEVHPQDAARAAGTYVAGTSIGGLLGRLVAGPIAEYADWRAGIFAVALGCAAASALFIWLAPRQRGFVPLDRRPSASSPAAGGAGNLIHRIAANLRSPRQLALYAQAFFLMGGFVALYNFLGFRLQAAPFGLPQSLVSLVFLAYLAGTWSSSRAGAMASRFGRYPVLLGGIGVMLAGILLTLAGSLPLILAGLVVTTIGFFAAHSTASGWTARAATVGRAQASSLYNLFYYGGSGVFGWLGGVFFAEHGWPGIAGMIAALIVLAAVAALLLLRKTSTGSRAGAN